MHTTISRYVRTLFDESADGFLTAGNTDDRFDYPVDWDEQTADTLAQQCGRLVEQLTELSMRFETLRTSTVQLTAQQLAVWNTYLRPFPKHDLDMLALTAIWEKMDTCATLTPQEHALADAYVRWYEENAHSRLPVLRCDPTALIGRARRYSKLVQLNAPAVVRENEAKRFAEEYVLYHCLRQ